MLYTSSTAQQKRAKLREKLAGDGIIRLPGAFNALSARLIERKGFDGVYVSGSVIAAERGLPDIGLTTLTDVAGRSGTIARMTNLPTIVDADTGFGEPMNAALTIQELEEAGVSGAHIEDQVNPKRCGHLDGKTTVDDETAVRRIRAAAQGRRDPNFLLIARTDMRAVAGLQATIERALQLVDAGADVIFPEALATLDEFEQLAAAVDRPILANMTEFGKSELFTTSQLQSVGVRMVIWPVSLMRLAMKAAERGLDALLEHETLSGELGEMQHRAELYELIDYSSYSTFDTGIADFSVPPRQ